MLGRTSRQFMMSAVLHASLMPFFNVAEDNCQLYCGTVMIIVAQMMMITHDEDAQWLSLVRLSTLYLARETLGQTALACFWLFSGRNPITLGRPLCAKLLLQTRYQIGPPPPPGHRRHCIVSFAPEYENKFHTKSSLGPTFKSFRALYSGLLWWDGDHLWNWPWPQ